MLLGMALRNLGRNLRRTALAVGGIALGCALNITASSFQFGSWQSILGAAVSGVAGHVVVQAPGWQDEREATLTVPRSTSVAATLREAWPDAIVTRRAVLGGLLTSPRGSAAVGVAGVEPQEKDLVRLDEGLIAGAWLADDDADGVIIGDGLAGVLQVEVGDKLVLMTQVGDGEVDSRLLRVRGVTHTGNEQLDSFAATVDLDVVQGLLPGDDPAHQIAVVLPGGRLDVPDTSAVAARLPGLDVRTWEQALPELREQRDLDTRFGDYLYAMLVVILGVGVMNTVLMGVMERVRELGTLLAIGMRPASVGLMLLLEGLWMGVLGALGGLLLAAVPYPWLYVRGVDFGALMSEAMPVGAVADPVVRCVFDPFHTGLWVTLCVVVSVAASLWPAWQAMRMQPVDAMRHV